jgi:hypothetical protein
MARLQQGTGRLSITDIIPSLGRYVQGNRDALHASQMAQGLQQAESLLGYQGLPDATDAQGLTAGGTQGAGLLGDPNSLQNQLKFGLGLMGAPGFGQVGNALTQQAFTNQLGLPYKQARLDQIDQQNAKGTTLMQNLVASGLTPDSPEFKQAVTDQLAKSSGINIHNYPESAQTAAYTQGIQETVNEQLSQPDMVDYVPGLADVALEKLPLGAGNYLQSEEYRRFRTLSTAWMEATLRDESGAAINVGEYDTKRQIYFPVPGDGPTEVGQKRQLRLQAESSLRNKTAGAPVAKTEAFNPAQGQPATQDDAGTITADDLANMQNLVDVPEQQQGAGGRIWDFLSTPASQADQDLLRRQQDIDALRFQ